MKLQLLLSFCILASPLTISLLVSASSRVISQTSDYTFTIFRQQDPLTSNFIVNPPAVSLGSTIRFTLPSQFLSLQSTLSLACTDKTLGTVLSCSQSGLIITVANYYATTATLSTPTITIQIFSVTNAFKSGTSNSFQCAIVAGSTTIDSTPASNNPNFINSIVYTPATFYSCSASAANANVLSYAPLTITVHPNNPIPSSGQFVVNLPSTWTADITSQSTVTGVLSCSGIGINAVLQCTYQITPFNIVVITVSNLATISLTTSFSITINSLLTPPVIGSAQTITYYSQWSDASQIDVCTTPINDLSPAPFTQIQFISNDNTTVQTTFSAQISLLLNRAFSSTDTVVIALPIEFGTAVVVSSSSFNTFFTSKTINTTYVSITVSNFPSVPSIISSNNLISFGLSGLNNPISTKIVSIQASCYRSSNIYQLSTATYAAVAATVSTLQLTPSSTIVSNQGDCLVYLNTTPYTLPIGSILTLTYPISTTVANSIAVQIPDASVNGVRVASATYQITNSIITINNLLSSQMSGILQFSIGTFQNSGTTQSVRYNIAVTDSQSNLILTSSTVLTPTPAPLTASILSSNTMVLATAVYSLSITAAFRFTALSIIIPTSILLQTDVSSTCSPNTFTLCTLIGNNLTFFGVQVAGQYTLAWGKNTNPPSLKPTDSFEVYTYVNGFLVQQVKRGIILTMTQLAPIVATVTPSALLNSAYIVITIKATLLNNSPVGTLTCIIPSEVSLTNGVCVGCTINGQSINIAADGINTIYTVTVSNVKNVPSFKTLGNISFKLIANDGFDSGSATILGWTNNILSVFQTTVSTVFGTGTLNTLTAFSFSLSNLQGSPHTVQLTISNAFGAVLTAAGGVIISNYVIEYNINQILSPLININLTTPQSSRSYTFLLRTYDALGNAVGISTTAQWQPDCFPSNCKTCLLTNAAHCLSCYSLDNILSTVNNTCINSCPLGSYLLAGVCNVCDGSCVECANSAFNCTACVALKSLDLVNSKCVEVCASGYYSALSLICTRCSDPCFTCTAEQVCSSCIENYFLLGGLCSLNCPALEYVKNATSRNCDPCAAKCLTCSVTVTTCVSCNNSATLFLINGNDCVSRCPTNYFLESNQCVQCQSPCVLCTNASTACLTCDTSGTSVAPVLYNNACIPSIACPIGNFVLNGLCSKCAVQCSRCVSLTVCTACAPSFNLFNAGCIAVCPNTTRPLSQICEPCTNCLTCVDLICTSCIKGQSLSVGVCVGQCPIGTYETVSNVCVSCVVGCTACVSATQCTACITALYLHLGACINVCPATTYQNITVCAACPSICINCSSSTQCTSCAPNYSLEVSQCVLVCSHGVSLQQLCLPCGLNCSICVGFSCQQCNLGSYLLNSLCQAECPLGTASFDGQSCQQCSTQFSYCTSCTSSQCLFCVNTTLSSGRCVPCSEGTYINSGVCTPCPQGCRSCADSLTCFSCISLFYLQSAQCVSNCPLNKVPNGTICTECVSNCSICNTTNTLCSVCVANVYLYNNLCVNICPAPLIVSLAATHCVTETTFFKEFASASKIIPFPFTIATVSLILIVVLMKCYRHATHFTTAVVAIISFLQIAALSAFIYVQYQNYINFSANAVIPLLVGVGSLSFLFLLNMVHARLYCKYIMEDAQYKRWERRHNVANKVTLAISALTFKAYRLVYSKLLQKEELSMVLCAANRLLPFNVLSVFWVAGCALPTITASALALWYSLSVNQEFFVGMDTLLVHAIATIFILFDLHHPDNYFIDEHETNNFKNRTYGEEDFQFEGSNHVINEQEQVSRKDSIELDVEEGTMAMPLNSHFTNNQNDLGQVGQESEYREYNYEEEQFKGVRTARIRRNNLKSILEREKQENDLRERQKKQDRSTQQGRYQKYSQQGKQQSLNQIKSQYQRSGRKSAPFNKTNKLESQMWVPKMFDNHGYLLKEEKGEKVRYDEHGYKVEIDDEGIHHHYNKDNNEIKIINGMHKAYDKEGYEIRNNKRYDSRGYRVQSIDNQTVYFQEHGLRVEVEQGKEVLYNEEGLIVLIQGDKLRRFNADGLQIVDVDGVRRIINQVGIFVRKINDKYEAYDPTDNNILIKNEETKQYEKYDKDGFRLIPDAKNILKRYTPQGWLVVGDFPNFIYYDKENYRIQRKGDIITRFTQQGWLVTEKGQFEDEFGYKVSRNLRGEIVRRDKDNFKIKIEGSVHRKFTTEGLEWKEDKLWDKRGNVVIEKIDENNIINYQKYDREGNRIWLDEKGYQVEYNEDGEIYHYDKVGDIVFMPQQQQQLKRPPRKQYRYAPQQYIFDLEEQYSKMKQDQQQNKQFSQSVEQVQQLKQFHHINQQFDYQRQFDHLSRKERNQQIIQNNLQTLDLQIPLDQQSISQESIKQEQQKEQQQQKHQQVQEQQYLILDNVSLNNPLNSDLVYESRQQKNLFHPASQKAISVASAADVGLSSPSHSNHGVTPLDSHNNFSAHRRSEMSVREKNNDTLTEYHPNKQIYFEDHSQMHEQDWGYNQQVRFNAKSNAETAIIFVDQSSETAEDKKYNQYKKQLRVNRNIEEAEDQLFGRMVERKEFIVSGKANPLVQYAKTIEVEKIRKSLKQKMYLGAADGRYYQGKK